MTILYILALLAELTFFISFSVFTVSLIYSSLKGSPYVPTRNREVEEILQQIKIKRGMKFYELGSGDARIARRVAKSFAINAVAVDINPLLTWYARFLGRIQKIKNIEFRTENIFTTVLDDADIVYLFLMPELIKKLRPKLEKELKKASVIISHGFKVEGFEKKLFHILHNKPFPTYYYRI